MTNTIIKLISLYQSIPLRSHSNCKYLPTCSDYMIQSLKEYGLFMGLLKGIKRILKCNPFLKGGYDPVKKKEKK